MARSTPGNYVPLDVNYVRDVAIRRAGEAAELLFIRALAYSKGAKTGGFVSSYDLEVVAVGLRNVRVRVAKLVSEGLWIEVRDGWRIRSWDRWNGTDEAFREERSASGKHGNHQRWHVEKGIVSPDCDLCMASLPESHSESLVESHSESLSDPSANRKGREGKGTTKTPSSADADGVFEAWWKLYPKKVGKADARKVWDRKIRKSTPEAITAGLRRWLPIWRDTDPQFIPYPSTWLQRGSWEDDLGELDVDAVLGPEKFQPPTPPDDLIPGSPEWQAWQRSQRDAWVAAREAKAREVLARRAS